MGLFDKIREPIFLKEDSEAVKQLAQLEQLSAEAPDEVKEQIENEIRLIKAGIYGEETIAFELKNSHIPMFILHDLFLTHGDLSAQIDYLIVTRKAVFVIECKNLIGNIEINSNGDFIRTISHNRTSKKEGIYSPITQNKRHLELIKQIRSETKTNALQRMLFERQFYETYRSVVVLANPQTMLNAKYAKKEIKQQVIRADQLVEHIRTVLADPDRGAMKEKDMEEYAHYFLNLHKENPVDYTKKYRDLISEKTVLQAPPPKTDGEVILCPKCGASMVKRVAKQGANAGKTFYGCSNYPKCRSILNVES